MEKKTMETLRNMLCGEIEDIAKKGNIGTHETLDILKDLVETEKNLAKIEHYAKEDAHMDMEEKGYSQRKYFIDADYNPYGQNSYRGYDMYTDMGYAQRGPGRMGNGSYAMGENSYMYYDPRYEQSYGYQMPMPPYSRAGASEDVMKELKSMMNETSDPQVKAAIQEAVTKIK